MRISRIVRDRIRYRVIVTLKSGDAFDGILYDGDAQALVLKSCSVVGGSHPPVPVDGELLVLLADVAFIQKP